ncbi:MAG: hypothetical protein LBR65_02065 [Culturomica sp.]|jgi:hypothetical protein|nr:hypothetical protein [Culturomica sp.]
MKRYIGHLKLAGWLVIAPLLVWQLTLKNTLSLQRECRRMEKELEQLQRTPENSPATLTLSGAGAAVSSGEILNRLRERIEKNRVTVERYTPFFTESEKEFEVYTGELVLSGAFIPLVRLLDFMEGEECPGKVVSSHFRLETDRRSRAERLLLTVLVQEVE